MANFDESLNISENVEDSHSSFDDFMSSIESQMISLLKESYKAPNSVLEHWQAFYAAINWGDNIIRSLLAMHLIFFAAFLVFRNNLTVQLVLFMMIFALVFFCERLNTLCSENWKQIASQNYFDKSGVFASIFFAGPLLLLAFLQLVNLLWTASSMLIRVKRLELRARLKETAGKHSTSDGNAVDSDKQKNE